MTVHSSSGSPGGSFIYKYINIYILSSFCCGGGGGGGGGGQREESGWLSIVVVVRISSEDEDEGTNGYFFFFLSFFLSFSFSVSCVCPIIGRFCRLSPPSSPVANARVRNDRSPPS